MATVPRVGMLGSQKQITLGKMNPLSIIIYFLGVEAITTWERVQHSIHGWNDHATLGIGHVAYNLITLMLLLKYNSQSK